MRQHVLNSVFTNRRTSTALGEPYDECGVRIKVGRMAVSRRRIGFSQKLAASTHRPSSLFHLVKMSVWRIMSANFAVSPIHCPHPPMGSTDRHRPCKREKRTMSLPSIVLRQYIARPDKSISAGLLSLPIEGDRRMASNREDRTQIENQRFRAGFASRRGPQVLLYKHGLLASFDVICS